MPIEQSRDSKQFSAFELSGWDTNIRGYNSAFGAVARQTVRPMLDAARRKARHAGAGCLLWPRHAGGGGIGTGRGGRSDSTFPQRQSNSPESWCPMAIFSRAMRRPCRSRRRASMPCSAATASCTCRNPQRHCVKYCACCVLMAERRSAFGMQLAQASLGL